MMQGRMLAVVVVAVGLAGFSSAEALPLPALGADLVVDQPCEAQSGQSVSLCYEAPAIEIRAHRSRSVVVGWDAPTVEIGARRPATTILAWAAAPIAIEARRSRPVVLSWAAPVIEVKAPIAEAEPQPANLFTDAPLARDLSKAAAAALQLADEDLSQAAAEVAETIERFGVSLADMI